MTTAHRGPTGEITLTVRIPGLMGAWQTYQIELDTQNAMALVEDLVKMIRQDLTK